MTGADLITWAEDRGMTLEQLAAQTGSSERAIRNYRAAVDKAIPLKLKLALEALESRELIKAKDRVLIAVALWFSNRHHTSIAAACCNAANLTRSEKVRP